MRRLFALLILLVTFVCKSNGQSSFFNSKTELIELVNWLKSNPNAFNSFGFKFDTIKSNTYSEIDIEKFNGVINTKQNVGGLKYKLQKINPNRFNVFFTSDSLLGCIQGIRIDSVNWFGIIDCFDNNTKKFRLNRKCNYLIGSKNSICLFTSSNSVFSYRECEEDVLSSNRVIVLNKNLKFENIFILDVYTKTPKCAVFLRTSEKDKGRYVEIVPVMDSMYIFDNIFKSSLTQFFKTTYNYQKSKSYSRLFPIAIFRYDFDKKLLHRLSEKVIWMYDEKFYLIRVAPWNHEW